MISQKDVKFPLMLDVYELCTNELQEKMLPIRSKFKDVEDKKLEKQQQKVNRWTKVSLQHCCGRQSFNVFLFLYQTLKKPDAAKEVKYEPFSFSEGKLRCKPVTLNNVMLYYKT